MSAISRTARGAGADPLPAMLRAAAEPLPGLEAPTAFGAAFDRFGAARVVLLGEATHGSSEFYRARAAITRRLIEQHGFTIVAVEADWPDAARIDGWIRRRGRAIPEQAIFARFPSWMWRNVEVKEFVEWLRAHNDTQPAERRVEFRGLDVYSLGASMRAVLDYLDEADPEAAAQARERYGCLTPWQSDPARYGRAVLSGRDPCEQQVVAQLRDLLGQQLARMAGGDEDYFDAVQNARIVRAGEQYYRLMYHGATESWNLRDRHMFETLRHVMRRRGDGARAVVWAHNSHVGNAAATEMGWQGEFNIGELCRTGFGEEAMLIGFGTDRGTVAAASNWDEPMQIKSVRPAREDAYEGAFRAAGVARSLSDLRAQAGRGARAALRQALAEPRLERAIGVIYRPQTELQSHYFRAVLPEQFDAFVWFEETGAITPLGDTAPTAAEDTYPFGL